MDAQLSEILACPDTHHTPLAQSADGERLTCSTCGRVFPVRDGIPVLLLEEASRPDGEAPEGGEARGDAAPSGDGAASGDSAVPGDSATEES